MWIDRSCVLSISCHRRSVTLFVGGMIALCMVGCVSKVEYPRAWPKPASGAPETCANIAGRYLNAGEPAVAYCRPTDLAQTWDCDVDLSSNLLIDRSDDVARGRKSQWVEIEQPDDQRLLIGFDDDGPPIELQRSEGDFDLTCDDLVVSGWSSVFRSRGASDAEAVGATAVGVLIGSGGISTLSRGFRRLEDGSLLMTITETFKASFFFVPAYGKKTRFVRWSPVGPHSP